MRKLIKPFTIDDKGIHTNILDQNLCFEFIKPPIEKALNHLSKKLKKFYDK